jgi:hypothetical protein
VFREKIAAMKTSPRTYETATGFAIKPCSIGKQPCERPLRQLAAFHEQAQTAFAKSVKTFPFHLYKCGMIAYHAHASTRSCERLYLLEPPWELHLLGPTTPFTLQKGTDKLISSPFIHCCLFLCCCQRTFAFCQSCHVT